VFFYVGIQFTNANGVATFDTIYPGWSADRATHINIKVQLGGTYISSSGYYSGASHVHTGQLFFDDALTDLVNQQSPYNTKSSGENRIWNGADKVYLSGGSDTLMNVQYVNSATGLSDGLITSVTLGVSSSSLTSTTAQTPTLTTKEEPIGRDQESVQYESDRYYKIVGGLFGYRPDNNDNNADSLFGEISSNNYNDTDNISNDQPGFIG